MYKWFINESAGLERNIMSSRESLIILSVLLLTLMPDPAHSETTVYAWQDESGALSFSDNPANVPSDAQMDVLLQGAETQTVSETGSTQVVVPQPPEPLPMIVTQGEFAVRLVEVTSASAPSKERVLAQCFAPAFWNWRIDFISSSLACLLVVCFPIQCAVWDRSWAKFLMHFNRSPLPELRIRGTY